MADIGGDFDAASVEPQQAFDIIPDGWYEAMIIESEMKPTAKGDGERLAITFQILDPRYKGRKMWDGLNLKNPSAQAVQISLGMLSAICRAVNVLKVRDSAELHNLPLMIKIGTEKNQDNEIRNKIKGYKARDGAAHAAPAPVPAAAAAPAKAAPTKAAAGGVPWGAAAKSK